MEDKVFVPRYDRADRNHMRRFLQKAAPIIKLIADDKVPWGSPTSAELADSLAAEIGYEREKQMEADALQELREDRQVLVNLYGAEKKKPNLPELYGELSRFLRKYGLFDEEVVLLEEAVAYGHLSGANLVTVKDKLKSALRLREADDASLSESEWIEAQLRRALRKRPLNREKKSLQRLNCVQMTRCCMTSQQILTGIRSWYSFGKRPPGESVQGIIGMRSALTWSMVPELP